MKSKIIIVAILLIILTSVIVHIIRNSQTNQPVDSPISETAKIDFCKEGTRGNDCIKCSCRSADDCKLLASPYVLSECAQPEALSKSTAESCLDKVRSMAIQASCVVPQDYKSPKYEVVCVNNTCGKIDR